MVMEHLIGLNGRGQKEAPAIAFKLNSNMFAWPSRRSDMKRLMMAHSCRVWSGMSGKGSRISSARHLQCIRMIVKDEVVSLDSGPWADGSRVKLPRGEAIITFEPWCPSPLTQVSHNSSMSQACATEAWLDRGHR